MCRQESHPPYDEPERRAVPPSDMETLASGALLSRTTLELAIARASHELAARFVTDWTSGEPIVRDWDPAIVPAAERMAS